MRKSLITAAFLLYAPAQALAEDAFCMPLAKLEDRAAADDLKGFHGTAKQLEAAKGIYAANTNKTAPDGDYVVLFVSAHGESIVGFVKNETACGLMILPPGMTQALMEASDGEVMKSLEPPL